MIRVKDNLVQWLLLALLLAMLLVPVVGTAVGYSDGLQGTWFQTQNSEASHAIACEPVGSDGGCGGG